jgi:hypothetical protein
MAARPFASPVELNKFLLGQKLTQEQANAFYGKAFVHVNLNTATAEEIMLIPAPGKRMAHEFEEYRPWRNWAQVREGNRQVRQSAGSGAAGAVRVHSHQHQHGQRRRHPDDSRRGHAHAARVQGISSVEVDATVRQEIGKYVDEKEVRRLAEVRGDPVIGRLKIGWQSVDGLRDC